MPDIYSCHAAAKVRCFAPPKALNDLVAPPQTLRGRIAPNELIIVGAPGTEVDIKAHCEQALASLGTRALVVDHTDGWSFFTLHGEGADEVFRRVSMVPLPAAAAEPMFFTGRVCDVAAKAFRRPGRIDVMTGMEASRHVQHLLEHAGNAVGAHVVSAPETDPLGVAA